MKKVLRISLITLGILVGLVIMAGLGGWWYLNATLLNFEKDYAENMDIQEITLEGFTFLDRNGNGELDIYEDSRRSSAERVEDLLSQMSLEEKIHLLKGSGLASAIGRGNSAVPGAVGTIVPTPRLGIPTIYLSDGPAGLRIEPKRKGEDRTYYCTAFPIGTALSSTWNTDLVREVGVAMGNEASEYGIDVILGPGANIHRHPLCGRNFEYYSEDPVLTGFIGAAMVNGIESNGVGTSVKHFVANNQETNRNVNNVIVSDRAMREIYLKGFEIIVERSQPWTIMSSYNRVGGTYTSESRELLTDVLRGDWKFEGLVMSDWFGGNDPAAQIAAGNDLLEPGTNRQWTALKKAAKEGSLSEAEIDTSVRRILRLIMGSKKMKQYEYGNSPDLEQHAKITRQSAAEGMILLKNEETLPIQGARNIALLGLTSYDFIAGGTGSGDVSEAYTISLEQGLKNLGFEINEIARKAFEIHRAHHEKEFVKPEGMAAMFNPYNPPNMIYSDDEIASIVASSDMGIITIGRNSGEGGDRIEADDFLLSEEEQKLIAQATKSYHETGKKVVVVLNIGGVIETASWQSQPDAILVAWQGGQEGGNSVADILSGAINPSGKLPMTFPIKLSDHASNANFPLDGEPMNLKSILSPGKEKPEAEKVKNKDFTNYEEGIYVGYRHFDKANLASSYPFGFGLSYSTYTYSNLQTSVMNDSINITVTITNSGDYAGKEVVQIYTEKPDSKIDRPIRELKSFGKTNLLKPGEQQVVKISMAVPDLAYWNEQTSGWEVEPGIYLINIGSNSRDIRVRQEIEL